MPDIATNLLLRPQLLDNHSVTTSFAQNATMERGGMISATGPHLRKNLYQGDGALVPPCEVQGATALLAALSALKPELTSWHCQFTHLSLRLLKSHARLEHVNFLEVPFEGKSDLCPCKTCHLLHTLRLLPLAHIAFAVPLL